MIYAAYLFYYPHEEGRNIVIAAIVSSALMYLINLFLIGLLILAVFKRNNINIGGIWWVLTLLLAIFIILFPSTDFVFSIFGKEVWKGCYENLLPKILEVSCKWETLRWSRIIINFTIFLIFFNILKVSIYCARDKFSKIRSLGS
jgi:hypothetical protein